MLNIIPRNYQVAGRDAINSKLADSNSTLAVLPTGTGKTPLLAMVIDQFQPQRAIVIAHREELIFQAREKIMMTTGLDCSIEMGELLASTNEFTKSPVVIATVQTLNAACGDRTRMSRFDPKEFGVLIVDEAHHSTAKTYRNVIHYFTSNNPKLKVVGLTATPDRSDEEALGQVFKSVAYEYQILDAIHDGWLVPVRQQMVTIAGFDISHVRTTAGDLNGKDLEKVMESEKNLQGVAGASIPIIGSKRAIVFTVSVKQAEVLCDIFNRHRQGMAAWVCGKTPKDQRRQMLDDFKSGKIQVMVNCNCFTEGFDCPEVEVVVMAAPTKSRARYSQRAGRCMRPLSGVVDPHLTRGARKLAIAMSLKPSCLLLDFAGDSGHHKLITAADILSGNVSEEAAKKAADKVRKSGKPELMTEILKEEEEKIRQKLDQQRLAERARKERLLAKVSYHSQEVDPFNAMEIFAPRKGAWDDVRILSEKGSSFLVKQGFNPDDYSYTEGTALIRDLFRRFSGQLALPKQCVLIKRYYPELSTRTMTRMEASRLIQAVADNGWKRKQPEREAVKP
jgi:superfamily II DNA or RNA helicase